MFEKIKEYWLYVVLWLIALWLLWWSYLLTHNNKKWYELEDKVITTTIQAISRWKNEKIQKNTTIWWQVLWEIWDENIWDKKIHKEKMLLLTSQNYDSIIDEWKITDDITQELSDWLQEWEVKYVQIWWTATEIEWQPNIKSVQLTKDNKVIIWNQTFEWKDLQKVDANLKWYDWSWYWFWPYSKNEARSAIDNYFTNWTPIQIWNTDKYIVVLDHKFNDSIKWKLVAKLWSTTWSTTWSTWSTWWSTWWSSSTWWTTWTTTWWTTWWVTQPPSVNDKAIIPWTKDWYTITTHVWEQLEKNVKETETVLLEKTITNWKQKFSWTIKITWNNTTVLENINSLWTSCDTWFKEESWNCIVEETWTCSNPIYLDSNGVTVKAKNCAVAWQAYQWNWETWYLAKDRDDMIEKSLTLDLNNRYPLTRMVTSRITDMHKILFDAADRDFNGDIGHWDTSNVTNMKWLFKEMRDFNHDLKYWDVSKVTDMNTMFYDAKSFNKDISNWDVSNVTDMSFMFLNAFAFNQDIWNWNTSNVTNMQWMFMYAKVFDQDISNWNVWKVSSWALFANNSPIDWTNKVPEKFR